jgi:hypothetical protein
MRPLRCSEGVAIPFSRTWREHCAFGFVAGLALMAAACTSGAEGAAAPSSPTAAPPTPVNYVDDCPITIPSQPYIARAPYLAQPPAYYHSVWYGSDDLWTMVDPSGATFGEKTFWWSRNFNIEDERYPQIAVTGRRLDAPGSFASTTGCTPRSGPCVGGDATNAYADFGTAMLVGVHIPARGCWEIRAHYKGAELAYIVQY